ncbi:LysR family transcriptional regulator [Pelagibacterium halotolerans]|uniref:LysR family transcriptional regulator n=1 Tax=Pelagibacterium halotolerans TaxID=531813 RepID=UPI0002EFD4CD|nr:LysR family transcriptional regulator [Pelagibacterium halotolerans]
MRFKKLDLNLLVALDHMLADRSVSIAADKMHMSQSAMSNALTRLRTYFDDPLLVQVGRRMELTPRAEAMRGPVRDILVRLEATIETAPDFHPRESNREFTILLSDYTQSVFIPEVLALARNEAPGVRFRLQPQTAHPYSLLERGEVDVLVAPEQFCSPEHPAEQIYSDRYVCVVWAGGALAGGPRTR